jgi:putative PIN family toxin of toxin-antitoxin system
MRVVFDSNIYISALIFPGGRADKAILRILGGEDELIISRAIIKEVLSVLAEKFSRDREALSHVAVILGELGRIVKPDMTLHVLKDDPDNRILECAVSSDADAIITGDEKILKLGSYAGIKIMSLAEYFSWQEEPES